MNSMKNSKVVSDWKPGLVSLEYKKNYDRILRNDWHETFDGKIDFTEYRNMKFIDKRNIYRWKLKEETDE